MATSIEAQTGTWQEKARHGAGVLGGLAVGAWAAAETASLLTGVGVGVLGHFVIKGMLKPQA